MFFVKEVRKYIHCDKQWRPYEEHYVPRSHGEVKDFAISALDVHHTPLGHLCIASETDSLDVCMPRIVATSKSSCTPCSFIHVDLQPANLPFSWWHSIWTRRWRSWRSYMLWSGYPLISNSYHVLPYPTLLYFVNLLQQPIVFYLFTVIFYMIQLYPVAPPFHLPVEMPKKHYLSKP
jgi:hypothetical protein